MAACWGLPGLHAKLRADAARGALPPPRTPRGPVNRPRPLWNTLRCETTSRWTALTGRERVTSRTRRSAELNARIRDLRERNAQLSAGFGPPGFEGRRTVGSTPDHVAKARAAAVMASMRALEAVQRTATMCLHAASAHDRAARLHEMLADANLGDVRDHRDRGAVHRRLAREDRAAADVIFRSQHGQPPQSGHS